MRQKSQTLEDAPTPSQGGGASGLDSRGFMTAVGRVAVVLGCLTTMVGLMTSSGPLWVAAREWWRPTPPPPPPKPLIRLIPGGVLTASWEPRERRLKFEYNADIRNEGTAPDTFTSAEVYLLDPVGDYATPGVRAALMAIEMTENNSTVRFPLSVEVQQKRALQLLVIPDQVDRPDPFAAKGVYRLVLELQKQGSGTASLGTYCFFMGDNTLAQVRALGTVRVGPYPQCLES